MILRKMKNTMVFAALTLLMLTVCISVLIYLDKISYLKIETGDFKTEIMTTADGDKDRR